MAIKKTLIRQYYNWQNDTQQNAIGDNDKKQEGDIQQNNIQQNDFPQSDINQKDLEEWHSMK